MIAVSENTLAVVVAIVFALVSHSTTYTLVHKLSKRLYGPNVIAQGIPTPLGMILHALVAALVCVLILQSI